MGESHTRGKLSWRPVTPQGGGGGQSAMARASYGRPFRPYVYRGADFGAAADTAARERHRALNAALEAEEIMPDISPGPEWYRELREDDQLAELAAERDRYQAAMAVAREPEPAPRPDPAPRTPPHHGGQPLRAVRLPDDRCRAPGDVR